MTEQEYLMHYGVLGMKWGVRKAPDYQYTSRLTKKYGRKADKFAAKGNSAKAEQYRQMQKRSAVLDKRQQEYAQRVSTKGNIAARLLSGGVIGGTSYTRILSAMGGQGSGNRGKKISAAILAGVGGWPMSRIINSRYVKGKTDEKSFTAVGVARMAREYANRADKFLKKIGG